MRASTLVLGALVLALLAGCGSGETYATTLHPVVKIEPPVEAHDGLYIVQGESARFRVTWACGLPPDLQADYADNCWLEACFPNELEPCRLSCESTYVYEFLEPSCDALGLHTLTVTLHENRHWVEERQVRRGALDAEVKSLEAQIASTADPGVLADLQAQVAEKKEAIAALDAEIADLAVPVAMGTLSIQIVAPLTIDTQALPDATDGRLYAADVTGTGGMPPYTWSAPDLPELLAIQETTMGAAPANVIEGWAKEYGALPVTVHLTDHSGQSTSTTYDLVIKPVAITVYFCGSGEKVEDWDVLGLNKNGTKVDRPQLLPSLHYLDRSRYCLELENNIWAVNTQPDDDCTTSYRAAVRGVAALEIDWTDTKAHLSDLKTDALDLAQKFKDKKDQGIVALVTEIILLPWTYKDEFEALADGVYGLGTALEEVAKDAMVFTANLDPSVQTIEYGYFRGWKGCQEEGEDAIRAALAHEEYLGQQAGRPFAVRPLVNIVGYSRGAVQCLKMARALATWDEVREINIISMDPAPGEGGKNPEIITVLFDALAETWEATEAFARSLRNLIHDFVTFNWGDGKLRDDATALWNTSLTAIDSFIDLLYTPVAQTESNPSGAETLSKLGDDAILAPKVSRFVGIYAEDERSYRFEALVPATEDPGATETWTFSVPGSHLTFTNRIVKNGHAGLACYWEKGYWGLSDGKEDYPDYRHLVAVVWRTCETLLSSPAWGGLSFRDLPGPGGDPAPSLTELARSDTDWSDLIQDMRDQSYNHMQRSSFLPRVACFLPDFHGCFSRVVGGSDSLEDDQAYVLRWNYHGSIWWVPNGEYEGPLEDRLCYRAKLPVPDPDLPPPPEYVYSLSSTVLPLDATTVEEDLERMTVFPEHAAAP